jgi:hypothetical protein
VLSALTVLTILAILPILTVFTLLTLGMLMAAANTPAFTLATELSGPVQRTKMTAELWNVSSNSSQ